MELCFQSESPERDIYRDPNVVRASDKPENEIIRSNTTAKMLSLFRQMEGKTEEVPEGKAKVHENKRSRFMKIYYFCI